MEDLGSLLQRPADLTVKHVLAEREVITVMAGITSPITEAKLGEAEEAAGIAAITSRTYGCMFGLSRSSEVVSSEWIWPGGMRMILSSPMHGVYQ